MKKVHLVSLGCPKNRVDSEVMLGSLREDDWEFVDAPESADVIVVNTCSFIQPATEESVETVLEMAQFKEAGSASKLIVTGCMVQRFGASLEDELPEVDHFLGTGEYHRIADVLAGRGPQLRSHVDTPLYIHDELAPRLNSWAPHSAYLKISEGCNHRCTFCIIPQLRGKLRSRTIESLTAEALKLSAQGVRELNIISQDTTAYGRDIYGSPSWPSCCARWRRSTASAGSACTTPTPSACPTICCGPSPRRRRSAPTWTCPCSTPRAPCSRR